MSAAIYRYKLQEPEYLYHYTNKDGTKGIVGSGYIKQSRRSGSNDDAVAGDGTYLTSMSPEDHTKEEILENNYIEVDSDNKDLADYCFEFKTDDLREDGKTVEKCDLGDRDVYIVRDSDIQLSSGQTPYEVRDDDDSS